MLWIFFTEFRAVFRFRPNFFPRLDIKNKKLKTKLKFFYDLKHCLDPCHGRPGFRKKPLTHQRVSYRSLKDKNLLKFSCSWQCCGSDVYSRSLIQIFPSRIQGQKYPGSRILRIKELSIFKPKRSRKNDPWWSSRIPDTKVKKLKSTGSRIHSTGLGNIQSRLDPNPNPLAQSGPILDPDTKQFLCI